MDKIIQFSDAPAFEITKTYSDSNGAMFIEGIASTTSIDETDERMSPEAISKMAARLKGLPLRSEHGKGWDDRLGEIIDADVVADKNNNPALWIKAKLFDWSSKAKDLFKMLMGGVEKMGLSVAGKVRSNGINKELVESVGKYIPTYHDVEPTEVSITDHPANLDTFAIAVTKSLTTTSVNPATSQTTVQGNLKKDQSADLFQCNHDKCDHGGCLEKGCDALKCVKCSNLTKTNNLLANLQFFNTQGQRQSVNLSKQEWLELGQALVKSLGKGYEYDPQKEQVITPQAKSFREEVNIMTNKGNLVSQGPLDPEVASFVKMYNPKVTLKEVKKDDEGAEDKEAENPSTGAQAPDKDAEENATATPEATNEAPADANAEAGAGADGVEKASTSSISSSGSNKQSSASGSGNSSTTSTSKDDSSSGSSDSSGSSSSDDSSSDSSTSSSMESLLSSIMSTLSDIKTSLDSSSSSSSTDSGSSDSSTSSGTSTDKSDGSSSSSSPSSSSSSSPSSSGSSSSDSSSSSSDGSASLLSLSRALESLKEYAESLKKAQPTRPATQSAANGGQSTATSTTDSGMSKALEAINKLSEKFEKLQKIVEAQKEAKDSVPNQRKGVAVPIEKSILGGTPVPFNQKVYEAMKKDMSIGFKEQMKYKEYGELPAGWNPPAGE